MTGNTGETAGASDRSTASPTDRIRRSAGALGAASPIDSRDRRWLVLALAPGLLAVGIYLATNPFPASGGGLYTKIAAEIAANGYLPPAVIEGYAADGVPFAYPPLQFYVLALFLDLGVEPLLLARVLPGVAVILALVPVYLLGRDLGGSRPVGAVAAAAVALNPQLLQWHVTAGGTVRAFAFLYALSAIYAGYRVFDGGNHWTVAVAALAFGVTVLTHPTYALFVVVTCVTVWAVRDRSAAGFGRGLAMGVGGLLVTSPWLGWAIATHGVGVFGAASGTHGGVGGGLLALLEDPSIYVAIPAVAAAFLVYRRRYLLPAWFAVAEVVFAQPRFAFTVGSILVPTAAARWLRDRRFPSTLAAWSRDRSWLPKTVRAHPRGIAVVLLVLVGTLAGGGYLAHEMSLATDPSTPEYVDEEAVAAMEWVAAETDADATFLVLGDAAEWFPALTDRKIVIGPWGVEWIDASAFDRQIDAFDRVSACQSVACVERVAADTGTDPEYVYVPKGQYTIRGHYAAQFGTIERSFAASSAWEQAYDGDGAAIYRRTADGG